jgi:hypothetical protein
MAALKYKLELIGAKEMEKSLEKMQDSTNVLARDINIRAAQVLKTSLMDVLSRPEHVGAFRRLARWHNWHVTSEGDFRLTVKSGANIPYAGLHETGGYLSQPINIQNEQNLWELHEWWKRKAAWTMPFGVLALNINREGLAPHPYMDEALLTAMHNMDETIGEGMEIWIEKAMYG